MSKKDIEAIYRLSPLQEGLMFHALYEPQSSLYFIQTSCVISGALNSSAFKRAWEQIVARHAILRTAFVWGDRERPLQVVRGAVELNWREEDWRGLDTGKQQERLELLLREDRENEFTLSKAPLTRFLLVRLEDRTHHFTWSFHHLLLDAWARSLVVAEMFELYQAIERGEPIHLQRPRPYRDYIAWLERQDKDKAEAYWRERLKGITAPTSLKARAPVETVSAGHAHGEQEINLSAEASERLKRFARQQKLTMNTLVQGAWALLLSHYSGQSEVVFGATVSGRPAQLEGVEQMVGLFINTLPVRVRVAGEREVMGWLAELQRQQLEMRQYEYSSLAQVRRWSEVPSDTPLFESNITFQNFPVSGSLLRDSEDLRVSRVRSVEDAHFPLVIVAEPGQQFRLLFSYDCRHHNGPFIEQIMKIFSELLAGIPASPDARLSDLMSVIAHIEMRERSNEVSDLKQTRLQTIKATRRRVIAPSAPS